MRQESRAYFWYWARLLRFFGNRIFFWLGIVGSEIFPTRVRARASLHLQNGARTLSSLAAADHRLGGTIKGLSCFLSPARGVLSSGVTATQLPETKGRSLE